MNGFSLLLLLSSVGATTSVETGANGQPVFTIRIESVLLSEMRAGQAVPILVAPRDRRLRQFKIAMTADANLRSNSASRGNDFNARTSDLFDYEPTQLENGEIEYVVQISPERLESLAAGKAIEGEIAAEIPEVHRFLIFVGVGRLPSQQQAAAQKQAVAQNGSNNPPSLIRGAEIRGNSSSSRSPATPVSNANSNPRYTANDPSTSYNRPGDTRTNWRNQPDQSTVSPPPFASTTGSTNGGNGFNRPAPTGGDRSTYGNPPVYNSYPQQGYNDPNPAYAGNQGGYGTQNFPANTTPPSQQSYPPQNYPPQNYPQQNYPPQNYPPQTTVAARTDVPPPSAVHPGWATAPPTGGVPAAATGSPGAAAVTTAAASLPVSSGVPAEAERPWTPLILTTLALFASLGANAYLGWLSWSFFWRFRDAVTESARARAQISSSRQAA